MLRGRDGSVVSLSMGSIFWQMKVRIKIWVGKIQTRWKVMRSGCDFYSLTNAISKAELGLQGPSLLPLFLLHMPTDHGGRLGRSLDL